MTYKIDLETAQHLCGLVSRFFDNLAESAPEFGEDLDPRAGDFLSLARDFTHNPGELELAGELDRRVVMMARAIIKKAE